MDNMVILSFQIDGQKLGASTLIFRNVGFVMTA